MYLLSDAALAADMLWWILSRDVYFIHTRLGCSSLYAQISDHTLCEEWMTMKGGLRFSLAIKL